MPWPWDPLPQQADRISSASNREEEILSCLPWPARREAESRWKAFRWMDDAVRIFASTSSRLLRRAKRLLTKSTAYGGGLSLLQTTNGEAFGFRWRTGQGKFEVEQELKWIPEFQ